GQPGGGGGRRGPGDRSARGARVRRWGGGDVRVLAGVSAQPGAAWVTGCVFRRSRPLSPGDADHRVRQNATTDSDRTRPPVPADRDHRARQIAAPAQAGPVASIGVLPPRIFSLASPLITTVNAWWPRRSQDAYASVVSACTYVL